MGISSCYHEPKGVKYVPIYQKGSRPTSETVTRPKAGAAKIGGSSMDAWFGLQQGLGNRGMQRLITQSIQRKAASGPVMQRLAAEEEELQMKRDLSRTVQRKSDGMPEQVQMKMESAFGASFSDVSIHEGSKASDVGALAYTQGSDIHFAPGKYQPNTKSGQELLGHELAHVIQQREGRVQANGEVNGVPLNDNAALEREADQLGAKAARG